MNGNETARLTATLIGQLRCTETEEHIGFIYLWNNGDLQLATPRHKHLEDAQANQHTEQRPKDQSSSQRDVRPEKQKRQSKHRRTTEIDGDSASK